MRKVQVVLPTKAEVKALTKGRKAYKAGNSISLDGLQNKGKSELTTTKALVAGNESLTKSVLTNLRHMRSKLHGEPIPCDEEAECEGGLNNHLLYIRETLLESIKLISDVAAYLGTEEN